MDWNFFCHIITECLKSHTLRGCVDINEWIKCRLIWMKSGLSEFPTDHSMCCFSGKNAEQRGEMLWSWCYYLCGVLCKIYLRYMFRLFQLSDSVPSLAGFVSFSHHIRLLQPPQPSHSANAFDSFSHRSRLIQLMQSSHSGNSAVCVNSMKWMNSWNEVDKLVKWSGWTRIMKFMISAQ